MASPTPSNRELAGQSRSELAHALVRCQQIAGETYCLQLGFTDEDVRSAAFWRDVERMAVAPASSTGAMSLGDRLDQLAAMSAAQRQRIEDAEIAQATKGVGSYKRLAHHPRALDPPGTVEHDILRKRHARRQVDDDWCGPAVMQMIDGADPKDSRFNRQRRWARKLGTTSDGTWIGALRQQINRKTSWDRRAGRYHVVRVAGWGLRRFWRAVTHQIGARGAPYVTHPNLQNRFHPYLSKRGGYGGHFQVGRGYVNHRGKGGRLVKIFEPFNEPDWTDFRARTWGPRHVKAKDALMADQGNQGNIAI